MRRMIRYTCPVCAYSRMPYPAEEGNICPCCGTEFGYDDSMGITFRDLRDRWVSLHTPWFSPLPEDAPPPMWNGVVQLLRADYDFSWPEWLPTADQDPEPVRPAGPRVATRGFATVAA